MLPTTKQIIEIIGEQDDEIIEALIEHRKHLLDWNSEDFEKGLAKRKNSVLDYNLLEQNLSPASQQKFLGLLDKENGAEKYYSDIQSAEETAENIQNEVSVYLSGLN